MVNLRLKEKYQQGLKDLAKQTGITNVYALPKLTAVSVNTGVGKLRGEKSYLEEIEKVLTVITGQKPLPTKAKKSISNFKLRAGEIIGYKVTLRGNRMFDFIDRLVNIALPRLRDLKPINLKDFDRQGNLTIGIKDCLIFPEINYELLSKPFGLSVSLTVTHSNPENSLQLVKLLGFPVQIDLHSQEKTG